MRNKCRIPSMAKKKIHLYEFNMNKIPQKSVILFLGKRNTGKSWCIREYLYHNQDIPVAICISPTEPANKFFQQFVPRRFIHHRFDTKIIDNFIRRQKDVTEKSAYDSSIDPRAALILDDCAYTGAFKNGTRKKKTSNDDEEDPLSYLYFNGRHINTAPLIVSMQYINSMQPAFRNNTDYIFAMRDNNYQTKKKLYDAYAASFFPKFDVFCQVYDQVTEDYGCMVMDMSTKSCKLEDQVFWFKAKPREEFRICMPVFWEMQMKEPEKPISYTKKRDDEEEKYNPSDSLKSRDIIRVHKMY